MPARSFWLAFRDLLVLTVLLGAVNLALGRDDLGWLRLNPTPWLLPAALVGLRYGVLAGILSSLAIMLGVVFAQAGSSYEAVHELLNSEKYFFLSLFIIGGLTGEIGSLMKRRRAALYQSSQQKEVENEQLRSRVQLLDETRQELQERLAYHQAPLHSLDDDLRTLFMVPQQDFGTRLLTLLHQKSGVCSAGIYRIHGNQLEATATLHPTPPLKQSLQLSETPLADRAWATKKLARVKSAEQLTHAQPFLAAFPWQDEQGQPAILLVQDMSAEAFDLQALARIELVLRWTSAMAVLRGHFLRPPGLEPLVSNNGFHALLTEAVQVERWQGLPSALLWMKATSGFAWRNLWGQFPASAMITQLPDGKSCAVLLPFSGLEVAGNLTLTLQQSVPGLQIQSTLLDRHFDTAEVWNRLLHS
jgi:hypothetical protein